MSADYERLPGKSVASIASFGGGQPTVRNTDRHHFGIVIEIVGLISLRL
jgi:hypothetical protein